MSVRATAANPNVLAWARERAGLSIEDVARRIHKQPADVLAWEQGEDAPTYNQLEYLAETLYKRPVALFFLPEPPDETPLETAFRTLPDSDLADLESDTRYALRDALGFQESLRELTSGTDRSINLITRDLRAGGDADIFHLAANVRRYLEITLGEQRRWRSTREALDSWRDTLENRGVFVFKRSFEQSEISGFCLDDAEFPLIVINNSTPFSRQIFTLFHELGHLLFGLSGITTNDMSFVERLTGEPHALEVACNRFAAEFLVPEATFPWNRFPQRNPLEAITSVATSYMVSREVILRRLVDVGLVDSETYAREVKRWSAEREGRSTGSGGNYYATQVAYLGRNFLNLAFSQFHAGNLTLLELAGHLRIKTRNVGRLEDFLVTRH